MTEVLLNCPCCEQLWGCMSYETYDDFPESKIIKNLSKCEPDCFFKISKPCLKLNGTEVENMRCEACYNKIVITSN